MKKDIEMIETKDRKWTFSSATFISILLFTIIVVAGGIQIWDMQKATISNNSSDFKDVKIQLENLKFEQKKTEKRIDSLSIKQDKLGYKVDNVILKQDKQTGVILDILKGINLNKEMTFSIMSKLSTFNQPTINPIDSTKKNFCFQVLK